MWLQDISVSGYRSIAKILLPMVGRKIIMAGRNNCGKSNILKALNLCMNFEEHKAVLPAEDFLAGAASINLIINVSLNTEEMNLLKDHIRQAKTNISKPLQDFLNRDYPKITYTTHRLAEKSQYQYYLGYRKNTKNYPLFAKGASTEVNNNILNTFQQILKSQFSLIECKESFSTLSTPEQSDIAELLMHQFLAVDPATRTRFNEVRDALRFILEGIGGEIQPAQTSETNPNDENSSPTKPSFQLRSEIERQYHVPLPYMGDGAQRVALILYQIVNSKCSIIGIEEPETNLHPGAQKRFRRELDRLCTKYGKKLILTTHSTIFLDGWEAARVFKVDIIKGKTVLSLINNRENLADIAANLGVSPGDTMAADGIIWVEGPSDASIYKAFLKAIGTDLDANNISLMWAGGDAMQHITSAELHRLNPNFVILIDSEKESIRSGVGRWKQRLAKECAAMGIFVYITQRRSIENYFSTRAIKEYYKVSKAPVLEEYETLTSYMSRYAPGHTYSKMRDAGKIAKSMTANEVENLGDMTEALHQVQGRISLWKQGEIQ